MLAAVLCLVTLVGLGAEIFAAARSAQRDGWYVVSFPDRIRSQDRARLEAGGARSLQYLPYDSYIAWLEGPALAAARRLDRVASVRPLPSEEKVSPALEVGQQVLVDVTVAASEPERTVAEISRFAEVVRTNLVSPDRSLVSVVVWASSDDVGAIARDPRVLSLGPAADGIELLDEQTSQIVAGNVAKGLPAPGYRRFLERLGLDGSGVTIAIADSGIDDNHPDLAGRVKARFDFTTLPDYRDSDGHGTHVAGIAGGSGRGLPGATDPDGFSYGQGIAPEVTFVDLGVLGIIEEVVGLDEFPPFELVSRTAVRNGAVGWNASWGSGEGDSAGYTPVARTMDVITRDADWKKKGAQPFTLVFAAGNSGMAGPGAPSEAKNLIAVASSKSARAGSIEEISSFSSRGPTVDGRIGPTVAAPGEDVVSTRSVPASVLCNVPPVEPSPFAAFYGTCSGTSMAAPQVTGSVALITQWWRKQNDRAGPSPALSKALLVNSATDMGAPDIPNGAEGWGRVNLKDLFDPRDERVYIDQKVVMRDVGQARTLRAEAVDRSKPLKVTLAWSDAPGRPNAAPALVNDLDLTVRGDGGVYRGNRFRNGWSVFGGSPDRREVLENVFVRRPSGGYLIKIAATDLPGDGIPYFGDKTDQDFALVISNARLAR
ncbi:MAG: S8 family serine peptidase [Actinomycetota bacterium]